MILRPGRCAVLFSLALLGACGGKPMPTAATPVLDLRLQVPVNWDIQDGAGKSLWMARPRDEAGAWIEGAYFSVSEDLSRQFSDGAGSKPTLQGYLRFKEAQARQHSLDYEAGVPVQIMLDGMPALRFERRYRLHSGAHRALVTLTVRDSKGYSLIGATAPEAFEDLREPFERLADSAVWR
ncbi:MAG: hypothetical protein K0U79_06580 [Gammaproteobacteria bacterium]|nr:hypothetical protein [Gammaproteobacteria bacterium]